MLKKELMTNLTLCDLGIHSNLSCCVVCDKPLIDSQKVVLMDIFQVVAGCVCPKCTSLYDYDDIDDTGYKFIMREDTKQVLSCMTDEYKVVDNKSVVNKVEKVLKGSGAEL